MRSFAVSAVIFVAGASGLQPARDAFPPSGGGGTSNPGKDTYAVSSPFLWKTFMEANFPTAENHIVKNSTSECVEWVKICIDDGHMSSCSGPQGNTQLHAVGAYKRYTGDKSMEQIEAETTKSFGDMKKYDPFFEYHAAFYTADLDSYVSALTSAGVTHFASTFTDPATKKQYHSFLFQTPGSLASGANSLIALQLLGNSSILAARTDLHRHELPRASSASLARAQARLAAAPRKVGANGKPVLTWVHRSFASSDLARDVQYFENVWMGKKVYEGSGAEGKVYSGLLTKKSTVEVRYVETTTKTQGPTSVAAWEKYQVDLHSKCFDMSNPDAPQGFDRLADNHFDNPNPDAGVSAILAAHKKTGLPYRFYSGTFVYIYAPNGYGAQVVGSGLPSGAGYDFCTQGITGHCNKDGSA